VPLLQLLACDQLPLIPDFQLIAVMVPWLLTLAMDLRLFRPLISCLGLQLLKLAHCEVRWTLFAGPKPLLGEVGNNIAWACLLTFDGC
jgi:hypothetical protein